MLSFAAFVSGGLAIVCTSVLATFGKSIADAVFQQSSITRLYIYRMFTSAQHTPLKPSPNTTTPHTSMEKCICRVFTTIEGGLFLIGGPRGCGKTTCLSGAITMSRARHPETLILLLHGPEVIRDRGIHRILGVPRAQKISEFVPEGCIIVVDQFDLDMTLLTSEVKGYLTELATDSANNPTFRMVLVVSDPDVFGAVMRLNGSEKVQDVCRPRDFKWPTHKVEQVLNNALPSWSLDDRHNLLTALVPSATPQVIRVVLRMVRTSDSPLPPAVVVHSAQQRSLSKAAVWQRFEDVSDGLFFNSIFVDDGNV